MIDRSKQLDGKDMANACGGLVLDQYLGIRTINRTKVVHWALASYANTVPDRFYIKINLSLTSIEHVDGHAIYAMFVVVVRPNKKQN
jgi:hypothetical protein